MEKAAGELKLELQTAVQRIVEDDDFALEDTDRAMQTLRSLKELKLSPEKGVPVQIPPQFKCPLSGQLMDDPVVVASGQTYERAAIQEWLKEGHQSCPKSNRVLLHNDLTPNFLLKEIIAKWRQENVIEQPSSSSSNAESVDERVLSADEDKQRLLVLLSKLCSSSICDRKMAAKEIRLRTKNSRSFRTLFGEFDAIPRMIDTLSSSFVDNDTDLEEDSLTGLMNISLHESNKKLLGENTYAIPLIIKSLKSSKIQTRNNAAAALFSLSSLDSNKHKIGMSGALEPLIQLVDQGNEQVMKDAASAIFRLCIFGENRSLAVFSGLVPVLIKKIRDHVLMNELLSILALVSSNQKAVVKMIELDAVPLLLGIIRDDGCSHNKENAVATLWSICSTSKQHLKEVDKEETENATLYNLTLNGTPRAKRKASDILAKINT